MVFRFVYLFVQQQMHAQQIPGAPQQPIPGLGALAGPLGAFAGPMGLPHGHQALLKVPQELHREDIKVPLGGPSADERLVSWGFSSSSYFSCLKSESGCNGSFLEFLQRNSVSPAEREKYRPRSPPEMEDNKRRKEDKMTHVSGVLFGYLRSRETISKIF